MRTWPLGDSGVERGGPGRHESFWTFWVSLDKARLTPRATKQPTGAEGGQDRH